jgi:hypothetical protein
MGCEADILQLDVTGIELDFPPVPVQQTNPADDIIYGIKYN